MPFTLTAVTAIAEAIGGVLAAGGIGAALVRIGGTLLLPYTAQALMPKPQMTLRARTVTQREPVIPREIVYGRAHKGVDCLTQDSVLWYSNGTSPESPTITVHKQKVSFTDAAFAFDRELVEAGEYPNVSAAVSGEMARAKATRQRERTLLEAEMQRRLALPLDQWEPLAACSLRRSGLGVT